MSPGKKTSEGKTMIIDLIMLTFSLTVVTMVMLFIFSMMSGTGAWYTVRNFVRDKMSNVWIGLFVGLVIVFGLLFAGIYIYNTLGPGYHYHKNVQSHLENAYELNTPEGMREEVLLAKQGMEDFGLTESDYCSLWYWQQTPDCSMAMQYDYLDGLVERIDAVIVWKKQMYGNNTVGGESLGDVYESKMDNLREFIKEGGESDWIAHPAYYAKNHPMLWYWQQFSFLCCIGWVMLLLILGAAWDSR